jgi:hypothetical protein
MTQYLLSIYQPAGPPPEAVDLERIGRELDELNTELKKSGAWVFADGLFPPSTATVVRTGPGGELLMTDGPYVEGKEHLGGLSIINAGDLDEALAVGRRLAGITGLPIEVRPFAAGA